MSRAKKGTVVGLAIALVAGLGCACAWGRWSSDAGRDLTDAEMAGLFGRQPDPPCNGCYTETVGAKCNEENPCICKTMGTCEPEWIDAEEFTTITAWRPWDGKEKENKDIKVKAPIPCFDRYKCVQGAPMAMTNCKSLPGQDGTCGGNAGTMCIPCTKGAYLGAIPIEEQFCEPGPNK